MGPTQRRKNAWYFLNIGTGSIIQDLWNLYWIFSILPLAQGLNLKAIKTLEVSGIRLNLLGLSLKGIGR